MHASLYIANTPSAPSVWRPGHDVRSGARVTTGAKYFSLLQNVQTGSGPQRASYSVGVEGTGHGCKDVVGVKLTTHLLLVPRLTMGGAIPLLPSYTFVACTETVLQFLNPYCLKKPDIHLQCALPQHRPPWGLRELALGAPNMPAWGHKSIYCLKCCK